MNFFLLFVIVIFCILRVTKPYCSDTNEIQKQFAERAYGVKLTVMFTTAHNGTSVGAWKTRTNRTIQIVYTGSAAECMPENCSSGDYEATISNESTSFIINRKLTANDSNRIVCFLNYINADHKKFKILVQYCDDMDIESSLMWVTAPVNASFGDVYQLKCRKDDEYIYFNGNFVTSLHTTCNERAKWTNRIGVKCWSAPNITLHHNKTCDYEESETVNFSCVFQPGYPASYTKFLFINDDIYKEGLIVINYTHNNAVVKCRANFTRTDDETIESNKCTLNITYGPKFLDVTSCALQPLTATGSNKVRIVFRVMANPLLENDAVWIKRIFLETNASWEIFDNASVSSTGNYSRDYEFELDVDNGTELHLCANYSLLSNSTCHPYNVRVFSTCDSDSQTTLIDTTTEVASPNNTGTSLTSSSDTAITASTPTLSFDTTVIAISASVGGLAVIVTIVLLCVIIKRRQSKEKSEGSEQRYVETTFNETEKRDVVNPLYGTRTDVTVKIGKEHSDSEKEEKANPIYQPTSSPISDETYAQVDKSSKKKQMQKTKGATNDAFTGDSKTALYTVVKIKEKPSTSGKNNERVSQPNSIYSEVRKDKTSKSKKEKPSKSGKGEKVELQPESMYAEVRKDNSKKPKKDDDDNEDLHGSSTKKE